MDGRIGWALAVAAVALGYVQWGWKGVVLAVSCRRASGRLSMASSWLMMELTSRPLPMPVD